MLKMNLLDQGFQKLEALQTDRQTDRDTHRDAQTDATERTTTSHSPVAIEKNKIIVCTMFQVRS